MTAFKALRQSLKPRLDSIHSLIAETMSSSNPLMNGVVSHYLSRRGKELRPSLALATADILGGCKVFDIMPAAAAIEVLHNASLIHDDVVDNSATRHGAPTINALWDNHIAVLVGDFFVSRALSLALSTEHMGVISTLAGLGATLSIGEMDQLDNARHHSLTEEAYFEIITHKTASLFRACVEIGGYAAGASPQQLDRLRRFADIFGQCFQITDDIFDYFPSDSLGKPTGNDLRERKVTLPLLYALNSSHPRAEQMRAIVEEGCLDDANIAELIAFAIDNGGIEYARATLRRLHEEGVALAREIAPDLADNPLQTMLDFVLSRTL